MASTGCGLAWFPTSDLLSNNTSLANVSSNAVADSAALERASLAAYRYTFASLCGAVALASALVVIKMSSHRGHSWWLATTVSLSVLCVSAALASIGHYVDYLRYDCLVPLMVERLLWSFPYIGCLYTYYITMVLWAKTLSRVANLQANRSKKFFVSEMRRELWRLALIFLIGLISPDVIARAIQQAAFPLPEHFFAFDMAFMAYFALWVVVLNAVLGFSGIRLYLRLQDSIELAEVHFPLLSSSIVPSRPFIDIIT